MSTLVIAHRGASGNAPENTIAAFELARDEGADMFIEVGPGNVLTKLVRRIDYDINSISISDDYEGMLSDRFHLVEAAAR